MRDRNAGRSRLRMALAVVAAFGAMAGESAVAASRTVEVENVRVGFRERYKVGTWTPVWIQLRGGLDGFTGTLEMIAQDENGTPNTISQVVQVAPGATQRVTVYVRPGSLDSDFATIRFVDGKSGRKAAPDTVIGSITGMNPPEPLSQEDYQVVSMGHPAGVDLIPKLPGFNADKNNVAVPGGRAREVVIAKLEAIDDLLPGRWYGFDAVDVVLVDTNDKEMLATLSGNRGEALKQWVQRGGHLVVAVSSNWQAVNDGLLGEMLPAKPNGQIQVTPFDSLESFTGGSHQVAFENSPARASKFEEIESRGGKVIASTLSTPLVVRGPYGFGRVTLIGLDLDTKPFTSWPDRGLFLVKALDLKGSSLAVDAQTQQQRMIISNQVNDLSTRVRQALDQFAGVTLIPFAWVAGFIVLYILLIGPGDYFFLKKVLKRMELTWITFPAIVVTVSLLAYYAAYVVKGTDLRINKIDVVDIDLESKLARGTSWINLFSPQNRDYSVEVQPLAPQLDPPTDSKAVVTPPPGTEVVLTWFGAPEAGLRGMNTRGKGMGFGGGGYRYGPIGKAERLEDVRVGIWSTKLFLARWFGPAPAASSIMDVDLQPVGTDRLSGTITNRLPVPMKNTIVAFGKQVYYDIGTIEPGETVDIETKLDRSLAEYLKEKRPTFYPTNYWNQGENIMRANLIREMMFHDSDASGQALVPSRSHHELDLTGQLALGRPMLAAEIDRPGTQLILEDTNTAKTDQTTVLRIILPLKKEGEAPKSK